MVIIISGIASGTTPLAILTVGLSMILGGGLGMALGDYLSSKSVKQYI